NAIQPWTSSPNSKYFVKLVEGLGKALDFDPEAPLSSLSDEQRDALIYGSDQEVNVRYKNPYGRQRNWTASFSGAFGFLERKLEQTDSDWAKDRLLQYTRLVPCPTCQGSRLRPEILTVRLAAEGVEELSIARLARLSVGDSSKFVRSLILGHREEIIAGAVLKEIQARLRFLLDVGLNYLSLDRGASTLSGGEAQRIRLATQIGSGLAGVLYVLDE